MVVNTEIREILVDVGRVAKVVKGGRRFRFYAIVVVGDQKGRVGYGLGKASEVVDARSKAAADAKKNMYKVPLREGRTLHHDVIGYFGASKVVMRSAPMGTGIIAGGATRAIFDALGIKDVVAKSIGSNNPHNVVKAAVEGLISINTPSKIAEKRGKDISYIVNLRNK